MKPLVALLPAVLLMAGCTGRPAAPAAAAPPATIFTGEVWTWDEQINVVTLRQGAQIIRVKVTPDQLIGLRLHQIATLRGEPAGPAEIETFTTPPPALVPAGTPDRVEATGIVTTVAPGGILAATSERGPIRVWVAMATSFRPGDRVRVEMRVQPLEPAPPGTPAPQAAPLPEPAASPATAPVDHARVTGRIMGVDPAGRITVESARGPVEVWVPSAARYRAGQSVEVRTSVRPAR